MIDTLFDDLPQSFLIELNQACDQFETSWTVDSIKKLVASVRKFEPQHRDIVAVELIALDVELRRTNGHEVLTDEYAELFPNVEPSLLTQLTRSTGDINARRDQPTSAERHSADEDLEMTSIRHRLIDAELCTDSEVTQFLSKRPGSTGDPTRIIDALRDDSRITSFQADVLNGDASGPLKIGEYTLIEQLGAGGMGRAFRAFHRRMHRVVAIKLLHTDLQTDSRFRALFEREVIATAQLAHPNIVTAFDAGESDGMLYLVTEYVPGRDLGRVLKEDGPLSIGETLSVIRQTATALEYAHSRGIIHRDVKPGNLLIDGHGTVKLLDLGLSRLAPEFSANTANNGLSSAGVVMGTAAYMSPEQATGSRATDERSDIYSLGCTLFTLLTDRACYPADTPVASVFAHRSEPVPELSKVRSDVPDSLDSLFRKMVAKNPDDRFQSMAEVLRALTELTPTEPAASDEQTGANSKTRVTAIAVSAAALLCAAVFFASRGTDESNDGEDLSSTKSARSTPVEPTTQPEPELKPEDTKPKTPALAVAPFDSNAARELQSQWAAHLGVSVQHRDPVTQLDFVLIPPGEFMMGSSQTEVAAALATTPVSDPANRLCIESEAPKRRVKINRPFYLSATEVPVANYKRFVRASGYETRAERNPDIGYGYVDRRWTQSGGHFHWQDFGDVKPSGQHPVANLTKDDSVEFCHFYSRPLSGIRYRLPTEAEWEFACRAGTDTTWYFGNDSFLIREYAMVYRPSATAVNVASVCGRYQPNAFGLFDMHGNVAEWCQDNFDWRDEGRFEKVVKLFDHYRAKDNIGVVRGGSVTSPIEHTRSARRRASVQMNYCASFRVVLEIELDSRD